MNEKRRWYDKNNDMCDILDTLKVQPPELIDNLAENVMNFSNIIRQNVSNLIVEEPISIGKERMLGYYKSFQRRRDYDNNWTILSMVNILSTLPDDDFNKISEGIKDLMSELNLL